MAKLTVSVLAALFFWAIMAMKSGKEIAQDAYKQAKQRVEQLHDAQPNAPADAHNKKVTDTYFAMKESAEVHELVDGLTDARVKELSDEIFAQFNDDDHPGGVLFMMDDFAQRALNGEQVGFGSHRAELRAMLAAKYTADKVGTLVAVPDTEAQTA